MVATNDLSIMTTIKDTLGLADADTSFDNEILLHINSVLSDLQQLGVGAEDGFEIEDKTAKWSDFMAPSKKLNMVKSYVHLRTKLYFDPSANPAVLSAMKEQIEKAEFRIMVLADPVGKDGPNLTVPTP